MVRDYRKIRAWQQADSLALGVYDATRRFPKSEVFGVTSQIHRTTVSVAANVVEGSARQHSREYIQFLYIASGSLAETGYYLDLGHRLGYLTDPVHKTLGEQQEAAAWAPRALINYIEHAGKSARQCPASDSQVQCP